MTKKKAEKKKISITAADVLCAWELFRTEWLDDQKVPKEYAHIPGWVDLLLEWAESYRPEDAADQISSLASDIESACQDISDGFMEAVEEP